MNKPDFCINMLDKGIPQGIMLNMMSSPSNFKNSSLASKMLEQMIKENKNVVHLQ